MIRHRAMIRKVNSCLVDTLLHSIQFAIQGDWECGRGFV